MKIKATIEIKDGALYITPDDNYIELEEFVNSIRNESVYKTVFILPF